MTTTQVPSEQSDSPHRPASTKSSGFAVGALVVSAAVVGGLFCWMSASNLQGQSATSWEAIPAGQPYAIPIGQPAIPSAAQQAADGSRVLSAAQLPAVTDAAAKTDVTIRINPPPLAGNYGPDGHLHDAFSPGVFTVPVGKSIRVTVYNYDIAWHSFTSSSLGLNVMFPPTKTGTPTKTTFVFVADSPGDYWWLCVFPCDADAMTTGGYMQGMVRAVAA